LKKLFSVRSDCDP